MWEFWLNLIYIKYEIQILLMSGLRIIVMFLVDSLHSNFTTAFDFFDNVCWYVSGIKFNSQRNGYTVASD